MTAVKKRRFGLGLLPPEIRLGVLFLIGSLFILINDLSLAVALFFLGLGLFGLSPNRNWKLAASAFLTGGMVFFYNVILSPPEFDGWRWLVFTFNQAGIYRGLVVGFRLTGMMLFSLAWLVSTSLPEIYQGMAWLKPARLWTLGILRGVQILKREFVILTQSLIVRGLHWNSLRSNFRNLVPLATMIIPRILKNAQQGTLAFQSHQQELPRREGKISVQRLSVRYSPSQPPALQKVSLTVSPGERIFLAGANRAGKTTLLRALGGIIPWIMGELRGRIEVFGLVTHQTPLQILCGTVRYLAPDPFASIWGLTVGQEISFLARNEETARKALRVMGIENLWEKETTKLSGGQQVRLVLAGILASEPPVLLLDNPLQELDPEGRTAFLKALKLLLSQKPATTVIVTDPFWQSLMPLVNRVLVLEEGKLVEDLEANTFFLQESWMKRCHLSSNQPVQLAKRTPGKILAEMKNVHVALEGNQILRGIDFSLRAGELVVIIGPNGAGKTTAMLTLAGAIAPIEGQVITEGKIGFVFQNPDLQIVGMTVAEELAFGPGLDGCRPDQIQKLVTQGLQWTKLDPTDCPLDLHPADKRILAIAAQKDLVSTLILDEPTIGLDSREINRVMTLVESLTLSGKAVVIITHDEEIARQADRVVIINCGKITFDGPPPSCPLLKPGR